MRPALPAIAAAVALAGAAAGGDVPEKWHGLWARQKGAASVAVDGRARRDGRPTLRVEHTGREDWSLNAAERLAVRPGEVLEMSADLRLRGEGRAHLSFTTYDAGGKVVRWTHGARGTGATDGWRTVRARLMVPRGIAAAVPRITGRGPATVWIHDATWRKAEELTVTADAKMPAKVSVANDALSVTLNTADVTLAVTDRRTGRTVRQLPPTGVLAVAARKVAGGVDIDLAEAASAARLRMAIRLEPDAPELTVAVSGEGEMLDRLGLPGPFRTPAGTYLVVPMNEGISYPVDDPSIQPKHLVAYGGHGICMAFWGATDGEAGHMAILETPDDARIMIDRREGLLHVAPAWEPQKGRFGYRRRLRYCFFDRGGHVAMCKRYRRHAREAGLLVTLAEKRKAIPAVDLLVGAVNVWCWEKDAVGIVEEMRRAGIDRILWSHRLPAEDVARLNDIPGVLTSRYDIYQDVMNPANFPRLRWQHGDWTTEAWPDDLMLDEQGDWRRGWRVKSRRGEMIPCGVVCDRRAPAYAEKRIAAELKTHPYRCRFIDTTTASPWRECYHADHPMTRTDSRVWKMKLLGLVSGRFGLVTGSETGHDAAVPHVHYFEGMLSLGFYRVPDAGRNMMKLWHDVPERVAKFQLGHRYRLPLWELVYHDCVVAQWYWGDYNNKLPALWDKRDLFNALYGTPPMFMFTRGRWREHKDRFARSYRAAAPIARATGYAEMTDHRFLTGDRAVQQTAFANGVSVTVNFGEKPYADAAGTLAPGACRVEGLEQRR